MKTLRFEMKTPEGVFFDEEVEYVVLPSSDGRYGVLSGHLPTVLWLEQGLCEYTKEGVKKNIFVLEGVAEITKSKVTVLSDFIETEEKAEQALLARQQYFAEEKQRQKESYFEYKQSSIELARAMKNLSQRKRLIND